MEKVKSKDNKPKTGRALKIYEKKIAARKKMQRGQEKITMKKRLFKIKNKATQSNIKTSEDSTPISDARNRTKKK